MSRIKTKTNEIKLSKDNNFLTKYGIKNGDEKNDVFYLRTKAKITPTIKKETYEEDVLNIKNKFGKFIENTIINNKSINNNYLSNIDISAKSIAYGKVSFLRYDVYVRTNYKSTLEENKPFFENLSLKIDSFLIDTLEKHNIKCR